MKLKARILLLCALALAAAWTAAAAPAPEPVVLKIIETTDVHGSIFPYDFINDKPMSTSLAQLSSYVAAERAKTGQSVILLDDGDILQGQPVVYYYNFENTTSRHIASLVMNQLRYD